MARVVDNFEVVFVIVVDIDEIIDSFADFCMTPLTWDQENLDFVMINIFKNEP